MLELDEVLRSSDGWFFALHTAHQHIYQNAILKRQARRKIRQNKNWNDAEIRSLALTLSKWTQQIFESFQFVDHLSAPWAKFQAIP